MLTSMQSVASLDQSLFEALSALPSPAAVAPDVAEATRQSLREQIAQLQRALAREHGATPEEHERAAKQIARYEDQLRRWYGMVQQHLSESRRTNLLAGSGGSASASASASASGAPRQRIGGGDEELRSGLRETRQMMQTELQRMHQVTEALDHGSTTIGNTDEAYSAYGQRLQKAGALLSKLKRKTEMDSTFIWYAFLFFVAVCCYIILKRLRILSLTYWAAGEVWSLSVFSSELFVQVLTMLGLAS
ncbi:unnamed protein product [Vitrella brassicaformis CCMP3155]|uniref:Sec20 C-terminal domain-containing protein n=1 Tax=Vitrella brassicaformis (strain CCMP3155) TaxID=1169540 RepID=A0A0G4FAL2_VITBC|nr:unnamed protein product [Vitrella brassicaformis CCMP3155]|eukprot:CEM09962.1 unnamed protein product [Vitrella brassicaformis CCMP3155]